MLKKLVLALISISSFNIYASDARSYMLMPIDTNLTELRYAHSDTLTSSTPFDIKINNQTTSLKQTHYFNLMGTIGALQVTLPVTQLKLDTLDIKSSGLSDPTILLGFGIYNNPALTLDQYKNYPKDGLSAAGAISMTIPKGKYDNTNILNTGNNRYSQKLELQTAWRQDKILLEVIGNVTHYNTNNEYRGNKQLNQKNVYQLETHASYNFTPAFWTSIDTFYLTGGQTNVNGYDLNNRQRSFSGGITAGYKIAPNQLIKLVYQNTISKSDVSTSLNGIAVSYNIVW